MKDIFAQRLKSARIKAGLAQQELADRLEVTKQAVSKYETGKMLPESALLIKMAEILGHKVDFFFRPFSVSLENVEFRKRERLGSRSVESIKIDVADRLERYLELEELMDISSQFENPLKDIIVSSPEEVEAAVVQLLAFWDTGINSLPNVLELLEDKGVKVVEIEADPDFDGLSAWVKGDVPVIVLNQNMNDVVRKRFTALHELGHLLLQIPEETAHKVREKICNRFAGAMLMPKETFIFELGIKRHGVSLNELFEIKASYGISVQAIMYRASDLRIVPKAVSDRFWLLARKNKLEIGWGEYDGKEFSGRFKRLLYKALAEEMISIGKAAAIANTSISELKNELQLI
jgi:Zn-dependent peptidase ImmA (M78 family)/DNA-binding XRE family transcriptional regulator